jgi:hypothetical protein
LRFRRRDGVSGNFGSLDGIVRNLFYFASLDDLPTAARGQLPVSP